MKLPDIPKVTNRFMKTLAQLAIDEIQHDASRGKFQNGKSGLRYSNKGAKVGFRTIKGRAVNIDSYKNRKAAGMKYSNGKKIKGFENQSTDTTTSFVNMKLTGRTLRGMRASSGKQTAIITYDRGEIVLGNAKRKPHGYDIYDLSNENKELILEDLEKLYSQRIKKYVSKDIIIK